MPFGRFRGCRVSDLPNEYLDWLYRLDDLRGRLRLEVDTEWRARFYFESRRDPLATAAEGLDAEDLALLGEVVRAGYRTLALKCHPDQGSDPATMRRLNRLVAMLREWLAA